MQDSNVADSINPQDGPSTASSPPKVGREVKEASGSGSGGNGGDDGSRRIPREVGTWSIPIALPASTRSPVLDIHEVAADEELWATLQATPSNTAATSNKKPPPNPKPNLRRVRDVRYSPYGHYLRITKMRPGDYLYTAREKLFKQMKQSGTQKPTKEPPVRLVYPNPNPGPSQGSLERYSRPQPRPQTPVVLFDSPELGPFFIPLLMPPINRYTLKELDIETIIVNPQLRHDLVSDSSLQFRPTNSRQKRQANDNYWYSIKHELERGCTCLTVDTKYRHHLHDCICTKEEREAQLPYSTIRFAPPSSICPENTWVVRTPSRIPLLIEELREVLIFITSHSKFPFHNNGPKCLNNPEFIPRSFGGHETWLKEALDVKLIGQEIKHDLFNFTGLLVSIGTMLLRYCAPVRDPVVRAMVEMVQKPAGSKPEKMTNVLSAIRMCFEIAEMMKLDLTNYQFLLLRPNLLESAQTYELATFNKAKLPTTITRTWIKAAYKELESKPELVSTLTPLSLSNLVPYDRLSLALQTALADIIFFPPAAPPTLPPPLPTTVPISLSAPTPNTTHGYPETFYLDQGRIYNITSMATDYTALYMILMLFRFLASAPANGSLPGRPVHIKPEDMMSVKQEIISICTTRLGLHFYTESNTKTPDQPKKSFSEHFGAGPWSETMENVILHLSLRASQARTGIPIPADEEARKASSVTNSPPNAALIDIARGWCTSHLRADSSLCTLLRKKVRDAMIQASAACHVPFTSEAKTGNNTNASATTETTESDSDAMAVDTPTEPALTTTSVPTPALSVGLEPLANEITNLGRRIYCLTDLNLRVYAQLYLSLDLFS